MLQFHRFTLDNGLRILVHQDDTTPLANVNILYDVGSRDENPEKTGFAHLFEHLMFGGSKHIPDYDIPLQGVGGDNNAFTTDDFTNYYVSLPKNNIETAFWLESDRMLELQFSQENLDIQKHVVIEEFKQRYLNQPYGDIFLLLMPLAYKVHPYQWTTIGKDIEHIEDATLEEVKNFFYSYYAPNNAILSISGNFRMEEVEYLAKKWFGPIERRNVPDRNLPQEPSQNSRRTQIVERDVPHDVIYKAYHMSRRTQYDFYICDLLSDILSNGNSSRFYQRLVKGKKLFSEIHAFLTGNIDNGLFIIAGNILEGVTMEQGERAIDEELQEIIAAPVTDQELQKVKNKVKSSILLGETSNFNNTLNLAYFELLGNADTYNKEFSHYQSVTKNDIQRIAKSVFAFENASVLYYYAKK